MIRPTSQHAATGRQHQPLSAALREPARREQPEAIRATRDEVALTRRLGLRRDANDNLARVLAALQRAEGQLCLHLHVEATQWQALDDSRDHARSQLLQNAVHPQRRLRHIGIERECGVRHVQCRGRLPRCRPDASLANLHKAARLRQRRKRHRDEVG